MNRRRKEGKKGRQRRYNWNNTSKMKRKQRQEGEQKIWKKQTKQRKTQGKALSFNQITANCCIKVPKLSPHMNLMVMNWITKPDEIWNNLESWSTNSVSTCQFYKWESRTKRVERLSPSKVINHMKSISGMRREVKNKVNHQKRWNGKS